MSGNLNKAKEACKARRERSAEYKKIRSKKSQAKKVRAMEIEIDAKAARKSLKGLLKKIRAPPPPTIRILPFEVLQPGMEKAALKRSNSNPEHPDDPLSMSPLDPNDRSKTAPAAIGDGKDGSNRQGTPRKGITELATLLFATSLA